MDGNMHVTPSFSLSIALLMIGLDIDDIGVDGVDVALKGQI